MTAPLISVRDLSHTFGEGALARRVLHSVNLDFYPGEIVIIMGPSGAGKTTLLSLAGTLRSVQSGSVRIAGSELFRASARTLLGIRRRIGFIFQAPNLVESLTVLENVQISLTVDGTATARSSREKALDLLTRVGLREHAHKHPRQLSGGQKQRVGIARALIRAPEIIMADEPTAALDSHSGREVVELMQQLARETRCAVLLVTHDSRILDIADRILTLEDGRIEETDLAFDRVLSELNESMTLLARYPSAFHSPDELRSLAGEFQSRVTPVRTRLAEVSSRRQSTELSERAGRWSALAEHIRGLDESVRGIAERLSDEAPDRDTELRHNVTQSLEFLLATAAACFRSHSMQDIRALAMLTGNRTEAQVAIRRGYATVGSHDDPQIRNWAIDLIDLYFRAVFLLNRISVGLIEDVKVENKGVENP